MDLKSYLEKKFKEKEASKELEKFHRKICVKCRRSLVACFCSKINAFETVTTFCILMHPMEAKKEKVGTGRLAHLNLKNSFIVEGINFDEDQKVRDLIEGDEFKCFLLYPGKDSIDLSSVPFPVEKDKKEKNKLVFILDGTWPCAKKMMKLSRLLHTLPRISFNVSESSLFHIKHQPSQYCLSTIESIYHLLNCLESWGDEKLGKKKDVLLKTLEHVVSYQIACSKDESRRRYRKKSSYKEPTRRRISKKWDSRKICFESIESINERKS